MALLPLFACFSPRVRSQQKSEAYLPRQSAPQLGGLPTSLSGAQRSQERPGQRPIAQDPPKPGPDRDQFAKIVRQHLAAVTAAEPDPVTHYIHLKTDRLANRATPRWEPCDVHIKADAPGVYALETGQPVSDEVQQSQRGGYKHLEKSSQGWVTLVANQHTADSEAPSLHQMIKTPGERYRHLRHLVAPHAVTPNKIVMRDAGVPLISYAKPFQTALGSAPFHQLAADLAALHALGLVHRDIKPDNMTILNNQVYLIDCDGIVPYAKAAETAYSPDYLSPELLAGLVEGSAEVSKTADDYALLYSMILIDLTQHKTAQSAKSKPLRLQELVGLSDDGRSQGRSVLSAVTHTVVEPSLQRLVRPEALDRMRLLLRNPLQYSKVRQADWTLSAALR